jgi:hypothetical protein
MESCRTNCSEFREAGCRKSKALRSGRKETVLGPLILKGANASRLSGQWRDDDYDVLENGVVMGGIFCLDAVGPQGRPWMWATGHNGDIKRAAHGYEATREAAMAAFAKSWRRG